MEINLLKRGKEIKERHKFVYWVFLRRTDDRNFTTTTGYLLAEKEGSLGFMPIQKVNMLGMFLWRSKTYIIISL